MTCIYPPTGELIIFNMITIDPTDPGAVEEELRWVRGLLQLEQKEDQTQFKLKNAKV